MIERSAGFRFFGTVFILCSTIILTLGTSSPAQAVGGTTEMCATSVTTGLTVLSAGASARPNSPYFGLQGTVQPRTVPNSTSQNPMTSVSTSIGCTTPWASRTPNLDGFFSFPAMPPGMSYFDANGVFTLKLSGVAYGEGGYFVYVLNRNAADSNVSTVVLPPKTGQPYISGNAYLPNGPSSIDLLFTASAQQIQDADNGFLTVFITALGGGVNLGADDALGTIKAVRHYSTSTAPKIVAFDKNDGSGITFSQAETQSSNLASNSFTRSGYNFNGWNTKADGSGTSYANDDAYSFANDLYLFAQWLAVSPSTNKTYGEETPPINVANASITPALASTGFNSSQLFLYTAVFGLSMLITGGTMLIARRIRKH